MAARGPQVPHNDDDDAAFADGAITLWANLLTLIGTHLRETGMSQEEMLGLLTILGETNNETIRSPRARASASLHLQAVYRVLEKI